MNNLKVSTAFRIDSLDYLYYTQSKFTYSLFGYIFLDDILIQCCYFFFTYAAYCSSSSLKYF